MGSTTKVVALISSGRYQQEHYEDVANLLTRSTTDHGTSRKSADGGVMALRRVMLDFADLFAADNPEFDRERFLAACGLES